MLYHASVSCHSVCAAISGDEKYRLAVCDASERERVLRHVMGPSENRTHKCNSCFPHTGCHLNTFLRSDLERCVTGIYFRLSASATNVRACVRAIIGCTQVSESRLANYCFSATFFVTLLGDGYGIDMTDTREQIDAPSQMPRTDVYLIAFHTHRGSFVRAQSCTGSTPLTMSVWTGRWVR